MAQRRKTTARDVSPIRIFTPPVIVDAAQAKSATPTRAPIELSAEDAALVRTQALLIQHHRSLAQQYDQELQQLLAQRYGVCVAQGAGWRVNVLAGLLEPDDSAEPEPEPEQAG